MAHLAIPLPTAKITPVMLEFFFAIYIRNGMVFAASAVLVSVTQI